MKDKVETQREIENKRREGVKDDDPKMRKLVDELRDYNTKIDRMNTKLEEGAEAFKRLWNARGGLREIFKEAKYEVYDVRNDPARILGSNAKAEAITELRGYCDEIRTKIEARENSHRVQEEGAKTTEEEFRRVRRTE